jgi:hypothetical protein
MLFKIAAAAVTAFVLSTVVAMADPVGRYSVRGNNPGDESRTYSGSVRVERTGDTYRVTWDIGNQSFIGTGIGSQDFLAVSYRSGSQTGLALYAQQRDGSWTGVWTYSDGRRIGAERWEPL